MEDVGGPPLELTGLDGGKTKMYGMTYADDALWVCPGGHAEGVMQQRVDASNLFYKFMGLENEPKKDEYTEMVIMEGATPTDTPRWVSTEDNPGTVTAREGVSTVVGHNPTTAADPVAIKRVDPTQAWRYLGKWEGSGLDERPDSPDSGLFLAWTLT